MYLKVTSERPFAISIASNGLRPAPKTPHCPGAYPSDSSIEVVSPSLCNFASGSNITHFVAVSNGDGCGYAAEGQLPSIHDCGGLHFFITPIRKQKFVLSIKTREGNRWVLEVEEDMTIRKVMEINSTIIGHPVNQQRLFLGSRKLDLGILTHTHTNTVRIFADLFDLIDDTLADLGIAKVGSRKGCTA